MEISSSSNEIHINLTDSSSVTNGLGKYPIERRYRHHSAFRVVESSPKCYEPKHYDSRSARRVSDPQASIVRNGREGNGSCALSICKPQITQQSENVVVWGVSRQLSSLSRQ